LDQLVAHTCYGPRRNLDRTLQIFALRRAEKLAGKRTTAKKRENLKDFPRATPGSCEEHYTVAPDSGKSFLG